MYGRTEKPGMKNNSGGEVIDALTFGNIKIILETYFHSTLQKEFSSMQGLN